MTSQFSARDTAGIDNIGEEGSRDASRDDLRDELTNEEGTNESAPLLYVDPTPYDLQHLKGSIAGVYSFSGSVGILLLTKAWWDTV